MEMTVHEAQLKVVNIIRDLLVDLATDGAIEDELQEMTDHFEKVAELIVDQIGWTVVDGSGDKVQATLSPADGWK